MKHYERAPAFIKELSSDFVNLMSSPMSLTKAICIASLGHANQKDKGGASYIRHPLRVMENLETEDEMIVAVLHDVIEDTWLTLDHLKIMGCTSGQIDAIDLLTKKEDQPYETMISRIKMNPIARRVKIQDIQDNLQLWRLKNKDNLQDKDLQRIKRYITALNKLKG